MGRRSFSPWVVWGESGKCGTAEAISPTREDFGAAGEMDSIRPRGANIVHLWSHNWSCGIELS